MPDHPLIDIVIPLYNEEKILRSSVERLVGFLRDSIFPYKHVITLVNNASVDSSAAVAADLAKHFPQVRVLNLTQKGKGLAIRTAWSGSTGDVLSFMDTDLSSDLNSFLPLVDEIIVKGADLAIGNRLGKSSQVFSKRFTRKAVSAVYNLMVRVLLDTTFDDHQCGFKAMKKESFLKIASRMQETGFLFDTELLAVSVRQIFTIRSIDIIWRDTDESKVSLFGDSLKMFGDLFRLRKRLK
ncbi:MAG: glycosyltransferase [Candidatus Paceibacterota bacterium]